MNNFGDICGAAIGEKGRGKNNAGTRGETTFNMFEINIWRDVNEVLTSYSLTCLSQLRIYGFRILYE